MTAPASGPGRWATRIRQILEHLTVAKLQIGLLRLRLRRGDLEPGDIDQELDRIEHEVDAVAGVAANVRSEGAATA